MTETTSDEQHRSDNPQESNHIQDVGEIISINSPTGQLYLVKDMTQPNKYGPYVYVLVDPSTGKYQRMITLGSAVNRDANPTFYLHTARESHRSPSE